MASIRIRVGAYLDPGAAAVFSPLIASAAKARKQIAAHGRAGADEYVGGYRTAPAHARKAFDDTARAAEGASKRTTAAGERAAREQIRNFDHVWRIKQRYLQQEEAAERRAGEARARVGGRVISGAARTFGGLVRGGIGLAGEVARGAGVDLSVGSLVSRNVATQKAATDITASSYVEGAKGNVGVRQDPAKVIAKVKEAANAAAIGEEQALAGLQKFVGKSTDLATGMDVLSKMAMLSKATGSNMEDMLDAAGDVAVKLEDGADKGDVLYGIMKSVAKQGQVGASEIRSMAPFIGRIASSAKSFDTGHFKGEITEAVRTLGTVFQVTKKEQGLTVGAAATATGRFVDSLKSKGGMKALAGVGIGEKDIFQSGGALRSLTDIIPLVMEKTAGDPRKIARAFPNVMAARVANAFGGIYRSAESEKKGSGRAAVVAAMGEYGGAMSEKQIQESLAAAMKTTESKAQLFQNRLQNIADENLPKVIGALEKLAPLAADAADGFAKFVGWAAENPGKAVSLALVASIAKAGVGEALSGALSSAMKNSGVSNLGALLGTGVVAATVTIIATEAIISAKERADARTESAGLAAVNEASKLRAAGASELPEAQRMAAALRERVAAAEGPTSLFDRGMEGFTGHGSMGGLLSAAANFVSMGSVGTSYAAQQQRSSDADHVGQLKADLATLEGAITRALGGTLKVQVVGGLPGSPGGGPAPGSTTGPAPVR